MPSVLQLAGDDLLPDNMDYFISLVSVVLLGVSLNTAKPGLKRKPTGCGETDIIFMYV